MLERLGDRPLLAVEARVLDRDAGPAPELLGERDVVVVNRRPDVVSVAA